MRTAPIVVFDTSVLLAGLASPKGGSAKLLTFCRKRRIHGVVTKPIIREALTHAERLHLKPDEVARNIKKCFRTILPAPDTSLTAGFEHTLSDPDDIHLLASSKEAHADYLVTLDQRHLLKKASFIQEVAIVSPKQLIHMLQKR